MINEGQNSQRKRGRPATPGFFEASTRYKLTRRAFDFWNKSAKDEGLSRIPWESSPSEIANWFIAAGKKTPKWIIADPEFDGNAQEIEDPDKIEIPQEPAEFHDPLETKKNLVATLQRTVAIMTRRLDTIPESLRDQLFKRRQADLEAASEQLDAETKKLRAMDDGLVQKEAILEIIDSIHKAIPERIENALLNSKSEAEAAIQNGTWQQFTNRFINEHIKQIANKSKL